MAGKYNLSIDAGTTYAQQFRVTSGTGDPLDLTGYTLSSELRVAYSDATASAVFDASILSPATSGSFQLELSPSSSLALSEKCYVYDVTLTTGSAVIRPIEGKAVIHPAVTR
jgi:hypothetical protein